MANAVIPISNPQEHEQAVEDSKTAPTVICVSHPSTPICKTFVPQYEALADKYVSQEGTASPRFYQMEFNGETSMLYKFSPNQLPVVALMYGDRWAKTIMGTNVDEVDRAVQELIKQTARLRAEK